MSIFLVDSGREWRDSQRQELYVARELLKKGLTAHVVAEPGGALLEKARAEGLSTIPLRMRGRFAFAVRRTLARYMRARGCRLVHVHDTFGAGLGLAAAAAAEVPLRVLSRPADSSPLEGKLPLAAVDAFIAGSDAVRSILVRGGVAEERVEVVPQGLDLSRFTSEPRGDLVRRELGLAEDDFLVGAVLPLEDERGLRALLEAAALARAQSPKVRFVVLGEGTLRLDSGAAEEGTETAAPAESVHYRLGGWKDAPQVLASLDMFAVFSHLDGLGGYLVEAMASGLPVAAADVGTARDVVVHRESGFLVPARNARALADAVIKVHFDKNLAARLAAGAREAVLEKYSAEAMARRIIGVYEYRAHRKGLKLS
ncbi:MAG: glycosyltransferase family 4 protein [Candidatus Aminicenantes bacterium]|nr:glycosyltransferase family 4 protein [Candidatus Aminicenantes bacterium]NLH77356.1 glycosyltransferase family 4 protein [Acidobacteriota bacterium]